MKYAILAWVALTLLVSSSKPPVSNAPPGITYIRTSADNGQFPILLNIEEGKVRTLKARRELLDRYAPGLGFSPEQYDFSKDQDSIWLNDSAFLQRSQLGADTVVLTTAKGEVVKYERVLVALTSGFFSRKIGGKNISFLVWDKKRYYISPPQECAHRAYDTGESVYEIDFIGSHSIIQSSKMESFFAFGVYVIDLRFGVYTILNGGDNETITATTLHKNSRSYKSNIEVTEVKTLDLGFTLVADPFVHDFNDFTDFFGVPLSEHDAFIEINESERLLLDTSAFNFRIECLETETKLLMNDIVLKSYLPLSSSPSGRAFFTQDSSCDVFLIDDYKDNILSADIKIDVYYGKDLENTSGRDKRISFMKLK